VLPAGAFTLRVLPAKRIWFPLKIETKTFKLKENVKMGNLTIYSTPGQAVVYSNPAQTNQATNLFPSPAGPQLNVTAGGTWQPNFATAFPQPNSFDATPPLANPVLFNVQPPSLSAGGIRVPNSSTIFKNPS
jgi:hypothetical protein